MVDALLVPQDTDINCFSIGIDIELPPSVPAKIYSWIDLKHLIISWILFNQAGQQKTVSIRLSHSDHNIGVIINGDIGLFLDKSQVNDIVLILILWDNWENWFEWT